jgi:hypothetical protein
MSNTAAAIIQAAQASRSGAAPAAGGTVTPSESPAIDNVRYMDGSNDETVVTSGESEVESSLPDQGDTDDTSGDQEVGAADPTAKPPVSAGKEYVTVTDEKGKRRIEIDFNNKDQLKKFVQMAHGARKWQAERDQALSRSKEVEGQYSALKSTWDTLEQAYQQGGVEGLIDLLEGKQGAFQEWEKARLDRHSFLQKASPAERELFEAKEQEARRQRELDKIRKENEDFKKSIQAEREAAELRSLESTVHPAFDRYRFADKLGDSDTEQMFDQMLWDTALKRLEQYEEQKVPVTADLVEKEFKTVATALRKRINVQAEKKAAKAVEQKKQEATENVQAAVSSGYRNSNIQKEASDMLRNGNLTGLLKQWNKYGSVFGGKK